MYTIVYNFILINIWRHFIATDKHEGKYYWKRKGVSLKKLICVSDTEKSHQMSILKLS